MTLGESYGQCRAVARRHGTTFFLATRLLPADRRHHVHALYALARTADDLVDEPCRGTDPAVELDRLASRFRATVRQSPERSGDDDAGSHDDEPDGDPILAAAVDTVRRFEIPLHCFDRFFASMRQDLVTTAYATWEELLGYMDGSAAAIGEMLLPLLDPTDRDEALEPARSLGVAFQLTNFLRDIGEDLDRGRRYVPQADLERFGVRLEDRRVDTAFRELMKFEIDRGRDLYRIADRGVALLPRRTRLGIGAARTMYAAILDEIEARGYDVYAGRTSVPTAKRLRLAAGATARLWR